MAKQLIKQCGDVRLEGVHISQGQDSEGKWQAYLLIEGTLLDTDGDKLRVGLSGSKKETLGTPQDDPWTAEDFDFNKDMIFTRISEMIAESKSEFAGI